MDDVLEKKVLVQPREDLLLSISDFMMFLKITLHDLEGKHETLKLQHRALRCAHSQKIYLTCQVWMLKSHIKRLNNINDKIKVNKNALLKRMEPKNDQISDIALQAINPANSQITKSSASYKSVSNPPQNNAILVKGSSPLVGAILLRNDILSKRYNLKDSGKINLTSDMNPNNNLNGNNDPESSKLLSDIKSLKKHCKHILDITDKYCVMNNVKDLKLEKDVIADLNNSLSKYPTTPQRSGKLLRCELSTSVQNYIENKNEMSMSSLQLPTSIGKNGWIQMTFVSLKDHLSFIIKTCARKAL